MNNDQKEGPFKENEQKFLDEQCANFKLVFEDCLFAEGISWDIRETAIATWATMCLVCLYKTSEERFESLLPTILNNIDPSLNFNLSQGNKNGTTPSES